MKGKRKQVKIKKKYKPLETRVEEEQKKLRRKQIPKKKIKKGKEISDKLKANKKETIKKSIHKEINYQRFLENQQAKLDYSAMFSYLGNLKKIEYNYSADNSSIKIIYKKNETISWEEIKEFTEEWKMDQIQNINRAFESSETRTAYHWWKYLNPGMAQFLYELSLS